MPCAAITTAGLAKAPLSFEMEVASASSQGARVILLSSDTKSMPDEATLKMCAKEYGVWILDARVCTQTKTNHSRILNASGQKLNATSANFLSAKENAARN